MIENKIYDIYNFPILYTDVYKAFLRVLIISLHEKALHYKNSTTIFYRQNHNSNRKFCGSQRCDSSIVEKFFSLENSVDAREKSYYPFTGWFINRDQRELYRTRRVGFTFRASRFGVRPACPIFVPRLNSACTPDITQFFFFFLRNQEIVKDIYFFHLVFFGILLDFCA